MRLGYMSNIHAADQHNLEQDNKPIFITIPYTSGPVSLVRGVQKVSGWKEDGLNSSAAVLVNLPNIHPAS